MSRIGALKGAGALALAFAGATTGMANGALEGRPFDITRDGALCARDITAVLAAWGPCGQHCPADYDWDGVVGVKDLTHLLRAMQSGDPAMAFAIIGPCPNPFDPGCGTGGGEGGSGNGGLGGLGDDDDFETDGGSGSGGGVGGGGGGGVCIRVGPPYACRGTTVELIGSGGTGDGPFVYSLVSGHGATLDGRFLTVTRAGRVVVRVTRGCSATQAIEVIGYDLNVDADGDGIVEDVEEHGDGYFGVFTVNYDADGGRMVNGRLVPDALEIDDDGMPVHEDFEIQGGGDVDDIARLVLRRRGAWPNFLLKQPLILAVGDPQSVHVFPVIAPGARSILGGLGDRVPGAERAPSWVDVRELVGDSEEWTFGVEGLFFANDVHEATAFSGRVGFSVTPASPAGTPCGDSVEMRVAPWRPISHASPSREVYAANIPGPAGNSEFLFSGSAPDPYPGLDATNQLVPIPFSDAGSQWLQDHIEIAGGTRDREGRRRGRCCGCRTRSRRRGASPCGRSGICSGRTSRCSS